MNSSQLSNIGVTTCFHAGADVANSADVANIPSTSLSTIQTAVKGVLQRFFLIQGFLKKIPHICLYIYYQHVICTLF